MMKKKHLVCAIIFCSTLSLYAIDINNTKETIEEAMKATEGLQKKISKIIEENNRTKIEQNISTEKLIVIKENIEDTKIEENITIEKSVVIEEQNKTMQNPKKITALTDTNKTLPNRLKENLSKPIIENNSIDNNTSTKDTNNTLLIENNSTVEKNSTIENNHTIAVQNNTIEEEKGSFRKGRTIFKTKLKDVCKMTGDEFAKNYTQEDWDDIYDNNEFEKVVYEICPAMKGKYNKEWTKDLYQFSLKYASDSDEIPEC